MTPKTLSQVNCQKSGILEMLERIQRRFEKLPKGKQNAAIMLQGKTGTGKSTIAKCLALDLGGNDDPGFGTIERYGAKLLTLETLRSWENKFAIRPLNGRSVLIIEEAQNLTADQMTALLTLLDRNADSGNTIIILTVMADDDEITGKRAANWQPLKDRCQLAGCVPNLGDIADPVFQKEVVDHVQFLIDKIGLVIDAKEFCRQARYSLRGIYGRLNQEATCVGIEFDERIFLGNDREIAAKVQSTIEAIGKPRVFIDGAIAPGNCPASAAAPKKPKNTARQKQFVKNLGDNGVTILDIVAQIIDETGRPMMAIEIARKFEVNYPEMMFVSKNPRCSINANISKDITLNGKDSRFVKVDRKIGLNQ